MSGYQVVGGGLNLKGAKGEAAGNNKSKKHKKHKKHKKKAKRAGAEEGRDARGGGGGGNVKIDKLSLDKQDVLLASAAAAVSPPLDTVDSAASAITAATTAAAASSSASATLASNRDDGLTAAERAFNRVRVERERKRLQAKAAKSHREQVEALNTYLDKLSEHHDIPKVSWTK